MVYAIYKALTDHVGIYLGYIIPIVYVLSIVMKTVVSQMKTLKKVRIKDFAAVAAIAVIILDFMRFVYLFSTGTGRLLPPGILFVKYAVGGVVWLWLLWYSYEIPFSRFLAKRGIHKA
ncbi:hypothetical protein CSB45_01260 [candidate division KSB3 bacterium]|uniref:Uncharacterized protein n=1 Tax=candidate division KSB3 bacterium TaxID=2044937 RepID=A0A2G6EAH7_9BACT|nr:MAG: hypothetical protein CSB45_01260 [candidate division KSB3 bacterium]PIE30774.1 MAG: hypothetical protein CSA57_02090 [candidate division KSB3 bacterium]